MADPPPIRRITVYEWPIGRFTKSLNIRMAHPQNGRSADSLTGQSAEWPIRQFADSLKDRMADPSNVRLVEPPDQ